MTSTTPAGTLPGRAPRCLPRWLPAAGTRARPCSGLFAGWVALFSWSGMVAKPSDFLMPTLFVGLLMALAGSGLRMLRVAPYAVAARAGRDRAAVPERDLRGRPVPARRDPDDGIRARGRARHPQRRIDLEHLLRARRGQPDAHRGDADGLRPRGAAVDRRARDGPAEAATGRTPPARHPQHPGEHPERPDRAAGVRRHRPVVPAPRGHREPRALPRLGSRVDGADPSRCTRRSGRSRSWLSSSRSWSRRSSPSPTFSTTPREETGPGGGGSAYHLTSVNPFIRLRRDLVEKTHTPMVYAETKARSTSYLRTTVLDRFTDDEWRPSPRSLPSSNRADGTFPSPPGLAPRVTGAEDTWRFEFAPNFSSTVVAVALPGPQGRHRGLLALRRADPRRGLRRRWAAAGAGVRRHLVHAVGHGQAAGVLGCAAPRPGSRHR